MDGVLVVGNGLLNVADFGVLRFYYNSGEGPS